MLEAKPSRRLFNLSLARLAQQLRSKLRKEIKNASASDGLHCAGRSDQSRNVYQKALLYLYLTRTHTQTQNTSLSRSLPFCRQGRGLRPSFLSTLFFCSVAAFVPCSCFIFSILEHAFASYEARPNGRDKLLRTYSLSGIGTCA